MRKRVALAQMLILDPKILLMDEPFSALDVQTRQLMENELLELWSADRKSVLFITHDLEEAISLSDRVDRAVGRPGDAADRRVRHRPAAPARRLRDPDDAALRRAARGDLARDEGRSAEGLCAGPPRRRGETELQWLARRSAAAAASSSTTRCCSAACSCSGTLMTSPGLVSAEFAKKTAFFFGEPLGVLKVIWDWFAERQDLPAPRASRCSRRCSRSLVGSVLGLGDRAVARAARRLASAARRSLHQGGQRDAARDPGADLRRVVRARHHVEGRAGRHAGVLHRVLQRLPGRAGSEPDGARQRADAGRVAAPAAAPHLPAVGDERGCSRACTPSVGMAFVGAVVGEYLGSAKGVGYLILQAEGVFDINTVFAGILVLTAFALVLDVVVTRIERAAAGLAAARGGRDAL